ncbi:hypothetical protein ACTJK3_06515 [Pseudomonas sp. 22105]|uniref:hypothetical protein n=1 Tax=unclassified Pseudomonas TaxID=196821 RepID=UPI003F837BA9
MEYRALRIALIGDFDPQVTAHQAIPVALGMTAERLRRPVDFEWLATDGIHPDTPLDRFDGFWCFPASPYKSEASALRAIELKNHVFFVATLFQPERAALKGQLPPLVRAFVEACSEQSR